MPDRLVRDELLESERWLGLRDNTARVCYISLILKADALGNLEANVARLLRTWRDYGVTTPEAVAGTLDELVACDLVRLYAAAVDGESRQFIHIPRYGQNLRYIKRVFPPSPWTTNEQKQRLAKISQSASDVIATRTPSAHTRSDVEGTLIRSNVDAEGSARGGALANDSNVKSLVDWAAELGIAQYPDEAPGAYQLRILKAVTQHKGETIHE